MNRFLPSSKPFPANRPEGASPSLGKEVEAFRSPEVTREQVFCWLGFLCLSVFLSLLNFHSFQLGAYHDDINYSILAQSLLHSRYYGTTWHPGPLGAAPFPFGFPLLLAPVLSLTVGNFEALKTVSLVATILNSALLFWGWHWLSRRSQWWGVTIAGLYSLHPLVIDQSRMVMSEPVFMTFCLIATILAEYLIQNVNQKIHRAGSLLLSGSLLFTVAIRSIGMVVVASVLVYIWIRKGMGFWKEMATILLQMLLLFGLVVWLTPVQAADILPFRYIVEYNQNVQSQEPIGVLSQTEAGDPESSSTDQALGSPGPRSRFVKFLQNIYDWSEYHVEFDIRNVVLPIVDSLALQSLATERGVLILLKLLGLICSSLIFIGLFRWIKKDGLSVLFLCAVLYIPTLFLWRWNGIRLMYPVLPQLLIGFLFGVEAALPWLLSLLKKKNDLQKLQASVMIGLVLFMILTFTYKSTKVSNSYLHIGNLQERSSWLKQNAAPSSIVMSEAPEEDYFYSGLKTLPYPAIISTEQLLDFIESNDVSYILVAPSLKWQEFHYEPVYSGRARDILPFIEDLVSKGKVEPIYSSDENLIRVFYVN